MSALSLAWRLVRAGGRFRTGATIAGNAFGSAVFLLVLSVPVAVRDPGAVVDREDMLLVTSVVVFLCLPVTMLLLSVSRLSASARDRRLASLRMLGLTPARTRLVAGLENGLLATAGVVLGLAAYLVAAPLVDGWVAAGPGWFRQPLRLPWTPVAATAAGLVALSVVVSLAPTRALRRGHLRLRREGGAPRPSRWRLVPLAAGVAALVTGVLAAPLVWRRELAQEQLGAVILAGVALTGIGLAVALPLAVRGIAGLVAARSGSVTVRLAAARLVCEPASTVRVISGVAVATFLGTCLVGIVAAVESTDDYVRASHAYEVGPQRHRLEVTGSDGGLSGAAVRRIESAPGVRAVIPRYPVAATGCGGPGGSCGGVFVGTCAQLNLLWSVPECRDTEVAWVGSRQAAGAGGVQLANWAGDTATVTPGDRLLSIDERATAERFPRSKPVSLFVPAGAVEVSPLVPEQPAWYWVLSDPGQAPREAVREATAGLPVEVGLQGLQPYRNGQHIGMLLWTMTAVVVGVGLLSTLLTAVDRAVERRQQVARQRVLGVPLRVLRGSQLLQNLIPLWLALVAAIGLGFLPLVAFLRLVQVSGPRPNPQAGTAAAPDPVAVAAPSATLAMMGVAALAAAVVVAVATLPGLGRRLTPDLLRRE